MNITSTWIELFSQVKDTWLQDYYNIISKDGVVAQTSGSSSDKIIGSPPGYRRRSPFIPFALKNDTGSKLWFTTLITSTENSKFKEHKSNELRLDDSWIEVLPGDTIPFTFGRRGWYNK